MENKRVGVLGGSFDPPTIAHRNLGVRFAEELGLDEVRFVVAKQNPLKHQVFASAEHRWEMVKMLIAGEPVLSATDFEISNVLIYVANDKYVRDTSEDETPSYTWHTMRAFKMMEPHTEFIILGGSDILRRFYKWHKAKELIEEFKFAIAVRPPHSVASTIAPIEEEHRKQVTILESLQMPDMSSTDVRTYLSAGQLDRAKPLLQPDVYEYALKHQLY